MAAISNIAQASPVLSSPNAGAATVRSTNQHLGPSVSVKQEYVQSSEKEKSITTQDVQKAVQQANQALSSSSESISFGYEEKLGQLFVTVLDKESGEVVREIPSKEFIQYKIFMKEMVGLLLDKQV